MAGKIKGVRFNSDTGKIYTQDDDGNEIEVDDGYSLLEKVGRSDSAANAGAFVNGALSPFDGGSQDIAKRASFANILGQMTGTIGMAAGLAGGVSKLGGVIAADTAKTAAAASKAAAKRALWRPAAGGRAGTLSRDFKPINDNIIKKAVGHESARKIEQLGLSGARELTETEILKLHDLVKYKAFDQLDQPLINRAKILLKLD